jgi:hypothetical protein
MTDSLCPDPVTAANLAAVLNEMSPANALDGLGQVLAVVYAHMIEEHGMSADEAGAFTSRFGRQVQARLTLGMTGY